MKETIIPMVVVRKGSITTVQVEAIVNPANSFGFMGGGVAGVLKKVGGQEIEDEALSCLGRAEENDVVATCRLDGLAGDVDVILDTVRVLQ